MEDTDLILLRRFAQAGDAEAFSQIVGRYRDLVYNTCVRILGNASDAEDVAQECFLRLLREPGAVRSSLAGWLHRCATGTSIDEMRRRTARKNREEVHSQMNSSSNNEPAWHELAPHLDQALDDLPDDLRLVVVEHFLQRRTQAEIAEQLGVSAMTVSRRIDRGIDDLRKKLEKAGVIVSAALLASLVTAHAATAAPAAVAAALGKVAIASAVKASAASAAGGAATGWTGAGVAAGVLTTAVKVKIAAVVVAAALAAGGVVAHKVAQKPELPGEPQVADSANPAEPATDRPSESLSSLGKLWLEVDKYPGLIRTDEEKFSRLREAKEDQHRKMIDGLVAAGTINENAAKVLKQAFGYISRQTRYRLGIIRYNMTETLAVALGRQEHLLEALASLAELPPTRGLSRAEIETTYTQTVRDLYVINQVGYGERDDPAMARAYRQGNEFAEPIPDQFTVAAMLLLKAMRPAWGPPPSLKEDPTAQADGRDNDELPWGKADMGVQCRLRPEKTVWRAGEAPTFVAEVRNQGKRKLFITPLQEASKLQLDGEWHVSMADLDMRLWPFGPGRHYDAIPIVLNEAWYNNKERKTLKLSLGKHIVRVAFLVHTKAEIVVKAPRAISNPVEIEIVPEEGDDGTAWGKPVDGLQAGLRINDPRPRPYRVGETISFLFKARNVSKRAITLRYTKPAFLGHAATVLDSDGKKMPVLLLASVIDRPVQITTRSLDPGETFVLGEPRLTIRLASVADGKAPPAHPMLVAKPGKYEVSYTYRFQKVANEEAWSGQLTTGGLEIEVIPAE